MIFTKPECVLIAESVAVEQGVDPALVCSVIDVLSNWNAALIEADPSPAQYNPALSLFGRNPQGRIGLMQISEQQAEELGYKEKAEALMECTLNVRIGCLALKKSLAQVGGNLNRGLLLTYGYSVQSLIPKIQSKVEKYREFLAAKPV